MNVTFRQSVPDDVYGIREVQRITWLNTYPNEEAGITAQDIKDKFKNDTTVEGMQKIEENKKKYDNPNLLTTVAVDENKIIGFCVAGKENENGRIQAIYLCPKYQGKGIGSKLIQAALAYLQNVKSIYLNVVAYNTKAIIFYKKHGFVETGKKGMLDTAAKLPSGKTFPEIELIKQMN